MDFSLIDNNINNHLEVLYLFILHDVNKIVNFVYNEADLTDKIELSYLNKEFNDTIDLFNFNKFLDEVRNILNKYLDLKNPFYQKNDDNMYEKLNNDLKNLEEKNANLITMFKTLSEEFLDSKKTNNRAFIDLLIMLINISLFISPELIINNSSVIKNTISLYIKNNTDDGVEIFIIKFLTLIKDAFPNSLKLHFENINKLNNNNEIPIEEFSLKKLKSLIDFINICIVSKHTNHNVILINKYLSINHNNDTNINNPDKINLFSSIFSKEELLTISKNLDSYYTNLQESFSISSIRSMNKKNLIKKKVQDETEEFKNNLNTIFNQNIFISVIYFIKQLSLVVLYITLLFSILIIFKNILLLVGIKIDLLNNFIELVFKYVLIIWNYDYKTIIKNISNTKL